VDARSGVFPEAWNQSRPFMFRDTCPNISRFSKFRRLAVREWGGVQQQNPPKPEFLKSRSSEVPKLQGTTIHKFIIQDLSSMWM
jgi:hypothetical protein